MRLFRWPLAGVAAASLILSACLKAEEEQATPAEPTSQGNQITAQPARTALTEEQARARHDVGEIRFAVDISERRLEVARGNSVIGSHEIAVGSSEYPTPTGRWRFGVVDINPDWDPPASEWTEDREPKEPGEPGNPMGRARLLFHQDYSIHGTDDLESLGTARSHGSIRVANPVVLELAKLVIQAGGGWQGDAWFEGLTADRTRMTRIPIEYPVMIEVVE